MLNQLEYRNEVEHSKLRPTKENVKEVPYIKNNPREKDVNGGVNAGGESGGETNGI